MTEKTGRDCVPYDLRTPLEQVRGNEETIEACLEDVGTSLLAALQDDGVITEDELREILPSVASAARANTDSLKVMDLLLEAGRDAAKRKSEAIALRRQSAAKRKARTARPRQQGAMKP